MRVALGITIVSQLAVWIALESVADRHAVVVMTPPVVNVAQPALAVSSNVGEPVEHLHAAHDNAHWIAAWNADHAFVSRDGGTTFARVLDAPGVLVDVGFTRTGDVVALRGATIGVLDRSGERWRAIPNLAVDMHDATAMPRLIDGGSDIVVVGSMHDDRYHSWVAASSDHGASWRFHELERAYDAGDVSGSQAADGTIKIIVPSGACESILVWFTWAADGQFRRYEMGVSCVGGRG
ncbi:MAG TPA: hypothetical protein VH143_03000 [Kofleriaceae bacterium]|nr:hypothetical protein [Kofleriaceae bacterium]